MNTTEPKDRNTIALRVALRARILDAARRIVMRDGLDALSMRKLAEAIGYSPASLYLHFESRDEIARALGREGFAQLLVHLEPFAKIGDPRERLHALAHAYVAFGSTHRQAYRLMYLVPGESSRSGAHAAGHAATRAAAAPLALAEQDDVLHNAEAARLTGLFADALEALAAAGHWRHCARGDCVLLARALWAMLHGAVALSLVGPGFVHEASLAPIVDAALDGWLGAPVAGDGLAAARRDTPLPARGTKKTQEGPS
ncbi:MAG TPA: TetR/AcrR family transcriptional regulator [Paraburkholderia sp.]|nr:TetR/AcrR family transcriptional regulator [Paraburkholderia sp.]